MNESGRRHGIIGQTGPKTVEGKRKSARNALKHGLSAKRLQSKSATNRIAEIASVLADGFPLSSSANELIQQAAESQYHIEQVRKLKAEALDRDLIDSSNPLGGRLSEAPRAWGLDWLRLDRYERCALKRRQAAFLELTALKQSGLAKLTSWSGTN